MEHRDVVLFMAVARTGSFSQAAAEVRVAQSALSRRVSRLEQTLGVALLERHPRGVKLTPAGKLLLERFSRIELELRDIEVEVRALDHGPLELSIGMPHGAVRLFSAAIVARFRTLYPMVRLHIIEGESAKNRDNVLRGEVNLALVYYAQPSDELMLIPLLFERIFVVCPATAEMPASFDVEQLATLPLILPGHPHGYRRIVEQFMALRGLSPNIVLEVNGLTTSLNMVQQGLGYTISTYAPVSERLAANRLVAKPIIGAEWEVELFLVHRRDRVLSPALRALKQVIMDIGASAERNSYRRPVPERQIAAAMPD
jgi:LysR family nitrogen assimilation transcriptional regulator